MTNCVAYLRVSTERQANEVVTSLSDQQHAIEQLAAKMGITVDRWYRDEGASGATVEGRPAFSRMLADLAADPRRHLCHVLVLNDSRFGRFSDPEESAYWRHHLRRLGWIVRFAEGDESQDKTARSVMRAIGAAQAAAPASPNAEPASRPAPAAMPLCVLRAVSASTVPPARHRQGHPRRPASLCPPRSSIARPAHPAM